MIGVLPRTRRVAIAGDWHGNTLYAQEAIKYAAQQGADAILHTGDLGVWPGEGGRLFLNAVEEALTRHDLWMGFVDGNHDDQWQLREVPVEANGVRVLRQRIWHLPRGLRWTWAGHRWLALGGATSLDRHSRVIGRSWWPEEAITLSQVREVVEAGPADVMLTHDIATGVDVPGLTSNWDPVLLREAKAHRALVQVVAEHVSPHHWWHGHMHVSYVQQVRFGERTCRVRGLDCDGTPMTANIAVIDAVTLKEATVRTR